MKVGIIGTGAIATELKRQLDDRDITVLFELNRKKIRHGKITEDAPRSLKAFLKEWDLRPDAVFNTMSTRDRGESARQVMLDCLERGIDVITCEKGGIAYFARDLAPYFKGGGRATLRHSAAVSGGTHLLEYLHMRRASQKTLTIESVLNGTLNYVFDQVAHTGIGLAQACAQAVSLKIAEPGAHDPLTLINGEVGDVIMKTCVLYNTVLDPASPVSPNDFRWEGIDTDVLTHLQRHAGSYRMIVQFNSAGSSERYDYAGAAFSIERGQWFIQGGFRRIENDPDYDWLPRGVNNAALITEGTLGSAGRYYLRGPGAGLVPTVGAMMDDLDSLQD